MSVIRGCPTVSPRSQFSPAGWGCTTFFWAGFRHTRPGPGDLHFLRPSRLFAAVIFRDVAKQLGRWAMSVSGARPMGHCKGKDNVKKRAVRRKKTERLALAKSNAAAAK